MASENHMREKQIKYWHIDIMSSTYVKGVALAVV